MTMGSNTPKENFLSEELEATTEKLLVWQEKYSRLYEAYRRVQKMNNNLENRLLSIVEKYETEKNDLAKEVASLTCRLENEKLNVSRLQQDNEMYQKDVSLAIQLLQCKPSNFLCQRFDYLPEDTQQKVVNYVSSKQGMFDSKSYLSIKTEMQSIEVPISTFPPTAMVYPFNIRASEIEKSEETHFSLDPIDVVSATIIAKILEDKEKERTQMKHCSTCNCQTTDDQHDLAEIITCNTNLVTASNSSPVIMKRESSEDPKACDSSTKPRIKQSEKDKLNVERSISKLDDPSTSIAKMKNNEREEIQTSLHAIDGSETNNENCPLDPPREFRHNLVRLQTRSTNVLLDNVVMCNAQRQFRILGADSFILHVPPLDHVTDPQGRNESN